MTVLDIFKTEAFPKWVQWPESGEYSYFGGRLAALPTDLSPPTHKSVVTPLRNRDYNNYIFVKRIFLPGFSANFIIGLRALIFNK